MVPVLRQVGGAQRRGGQLGAQVNRNSPEIANLRKQYPDTLDFYRWLEWIAAEQLSSAQQAAKDAGMHIGIMSDMAVGVHPSGADVWWNPERFAKGATVGAPPDMFNQQGQNWSQPPLSPINLETTGYEAYRNMVHGMFARAGAVRIDHILGLFRLWWIPENRSAMDGAYVYYDSDIMLGVLAIEASRAGGVVVGEDLGVVPDHVADSLSSHGILGCAVEWFEQCDGVFRAPSQWRPYALASVNTHDLPPAAGYLEYEHVKIRERLGLLTGPAEEFEASAKPSRMRCWPCWSSRVILMPTLPNIVRSRGGYRRRAVPRTEGFAVQAARRLDHPRGGGEACAEPAGHQQRIPELAHPTGRRQGQRGTARNPLRHPRCPTLRPNLQFLTRFTSL